MVVPFRKRIGADSAFEREYTTLLAQQENRISMLVILEHSCYNQAMGMRLYRVDTPRAV